MIHTRPIFVYILFFSCSCWIRLFPTVWLNMAQQRKAKKTESVNMKVLETDGNGIESFEIYVSGTKCGFCKEIVAEEIVAESGSLLALPNAADPWEGPAWACMDWSGLWILHYIIFQCIYSYIYYTCTTLCSYIVRLSIFHRPQLSGCWNKSTRRLALAAVSSGLAVEVFLWASREFPSYGLVAISCNFCTSSKQELARARQTKCMYMYSRDNWQACCDLVWVDAP